MRYISTPEWRTLKTKQKHLRTACFFSSAYNTGVYKSWATGRPGYENFFFLRLRLKFVGSEYGKLLLCAQNFEVAPIFWGNFNAPVIIVFLQSRSKFRTFK
jgi:hypothetical protein